ncbi:hypothetical protein QOZ80_2AG0111060 [Eleusine coracana subsp. coracana]|nr:hypothetical protein QOZ80_2AG0111060 [Eleusine coracana subsp. coracana]
MQGQTTRAPALSSRNSVSLPLLLATPLTSASAPSTMAGVSCCRCGGAPDELLRCLRCNRLPHTSSCPEIERCDCIEVGLLDSKPREDEVPSWAMDLAAVDASVPCRKDRFCPTCLVGFTGRRCPAAHMHAGGQGADAIEIHVLRECDSLGAFVDVMQIYDLYNCSEIQLETDLAPAPRMLRHLVPLHPAKCGVRKKNCSYVRIGGERLYCSMKCQVYWQAEAGMGAPSHPFVEALLAEDFTTAHQRDAFCTTCRVAFFTAVYNDHADHLSLKIISIGDRFFARVPATETWLSNFASVQEYVEGYRLLPLSP